MRRLALLVAGLCLAAIPVRAGGDIAGGGDIAAGGVFAEEHCARCHAVGPTGESPLAEAPHFRDFQKKWPLENLEEALGEGIVVGHPDMPQFELEPDQINDLLAYLASLPAD